MSFSFPQATQAQAEAGLDDSTLMTPLRTAQAIAALAPAGIGGATYGRTYLTSDASLYVNQTSGSDATGTGSSAAPFATITKAWTYTRCKLDLAGERNVICIVAADYSLHDVLEGDLFGSVGPQSFLIRGSASDSSRMFSGSLTAQNGARFRLGYLQAQPTAGTTVNVTDGVVEFGGINLNTYGSGPMFNLVGPRSKLRAVGACTIVGVGTCRHVFCAEDNAQAELGQSFYIAGAPTWSIAFCQADLGAQIDGTGFSFGGSGNATGPRYCSSLGGKVWTGGAGGPNFFPGNAPGTSVGAFYQ